MEIDLVKNQVDRKLVYDMISVHIYPEKQKD